MKLLYCRSIFVLLFIGASICQQSAGQITIRVEDFTSQIGQSSNIANYTSTDVAELQTIVNATGENQTYDFTGVALDDTLLGNVTYHGDPEGLPAAEDYPTSNHIMAVQLGSELVAQDSTVWIYNRIESDAAYTLGGAFIYVDPDTGDEDTLSFVYDPPRLDFPLPVTYGDAWADTTTFFGIETITESEVEGWGSLVTSAGSFGALRIRVTSTTNVFGFEDQSHHVEFVASNAAAGAIISLDSDGVTPVSADISAWALGTAAESDELPRHVHLEQNYPNPFNPMTTFAYKLETSGHVRLTVHDMLGRTVAVPVDGIQPAGDHKITFDAADLPSGTYMYRIRTDAGTQSKAMVLTK